MRKLAALALAALTCGAAACAPKATPVVVSTTPRYPEFLRPNVPEGLARTRAAASFEGAWTLLQGGDLKNAERALTTILSGSPSFFPAEAAAGYVELARNNPAAGLRRFDRALSLQADYVSALVGRGQALSALERETEAADAFERALAGDASLTDLGPRVAVLRFRGLERDLAAAREAAQSHDPDRAIQLYQAAIARSPDSAMLYREVAGVERRKGDLDQALVHLRQAAALDPTDVLALRQIAELLDSRGNVEGAISAYNAVLAVETDPEVEARRDALRNLAAAAKMPQEYRAIESAPQITRGDLAALIALRLNPLLGTPGSADAAVITDVRGHWAEPWIMEVARAGVIPPYENHTFQPRGTVRRADLAEAIGRLLPKVAQLTPGKPHPWENSRGRFADVSASHLSYPAVSAAVASGVIPLATDRVFQPARPVTGAEAIDAIARLEAMTRPSGSSPVSR
jgi:tetratricopeptide (TPR) repeat protein